MTLLPSLPFLTATTTGRTKPVACHCCSIHAIRSTQMAHASATHPRGRRCAGGAAPTGATPAPEVTAGAPAAAAPPIPELAKPALPPEAAASASAAAAARLSSRSCTSSGKSFRNVARLGDVSMFHSRDSAAMARLAASDVSMLPTVAPLSSMNDCRPEVEEGGGGGGKCVDDQRTYQNR
jgi:hypothetical protein